MSQYVNLCLFSSCDLLHKDGAVSVPFHSVSAVEMIEYFETRFSDFRRNATNIHIFENPFCVEVSDASKKLQLGVMKLQFCIVVSTRKLFCLSSLSYINQYNIWQVYLVACMHVNRLFRV
jgi:hypothetical protein